MVPSDKFPLLGWQLGETFHRSALRQCLVNYAVRTIGGPSDKFPLLGWQLRYFIVLPWEQLYAGSIHLELPHQPWCYETIWWSCVRMGWLTESRQTLLRFIYLHSERYVTCAAKASAHINLISRGA
jgi:hypothetical protein